MHQNINVNRSVDVVVKMIKNNFNNAYEYEDKIHVTTNKGKRFGKTKIRNEIETRKGFEG